MKTRHLTLSAIVLAALIVIAYIPIIPLPLVPITIQNLGIMLAGALLGGRKGFITVALLLLLAMLGLPVLTVVLVDSHVSLVQLLVTCGHTLLAQA